jgi:hypothetical protein
MGLIPKYDAKGQLSQTGRNYKLTYTVPETGEVEELSVKKKDDVRIALKDCPNMQKYLLSIIRGEIEAPENTIPNEDMDSEMSDEDFEKMMKEDNYGVDDEDGAEELESSSWDDM